MSELLYFIAGMFVSALLINFGIKSYFREKRKHLSHMMHMGQQQ